METLKKTMRRCLRCDLCKLPITAAKLEVAQHSRANAGREARLRKSTAASISVSVTKVVDALHKTLHASASSPLSSEIATYKLDLGLISRLDSWTTRLSGM